MGNPAVDDLKSIQAHGQIQKLFIYYVVHGEQRRRAYVIPTDPKTANQKQIRGEFEEHANEWSGYEPAEKEYYNSLAKKWSLKMTGYNLYMKWKLLKK